MFASANMYFRFDAHRISLPSTIIVSHMVMFSFFFLLIAQ